MKIFLQGTDIYKLVNLTEATLACLHLGIQVKLGLCVTLSRNHCCHTVQKRTVSQFHAGISEFNS